ncbi:MAG: hypothetical protein ABEK50_08800 [bacterium]
MNRLSLIVCLGLIVSLGLIGCGESVNYDKAKQQAGENTKEYLLHVSGMT